MRFAMWLQIVSVGSIGAFLVAGHLAGADEGKQLPGGPDQESTQVDQLVAALLTEYAPPTLEQIIAEVGTIPTLVDLTAPLDSNSAVPGRRVVTGEDAKRVQDLTDTISSLRREGRYAEALPLAQEKLAILERGLGQEHWQTMDSARLVERLTAVAALPADAQAALAEADRREAEIEKLRRGDDRDGALGLALARLETLRRLLPPHDEEVAAALNLVGVILKSKRDYAPAGLFYRCAYKVRRERLGVRHPDVLVSLNNLALLVKADGDLTGAAALLRHAVAIGREVLGDEHPDLAPSLNSLATVLEGQGDYAVAEQFYVRSIAAQAALPRDQQLGMAFSLHNLANLRSLRGDHASAERLLYEALSLLRDLLGPEGQWVANSLNSLAAVLVRKGDLAAADGYYSDALAMSRKLLGEKDPQVAAILNNLGHLNKLRGDFLAAEKFYLQALAAFRQASDQRNVAKTLNNLGALMEAKGDYSGAAAKHNEALVMRRTLHGENHPEVAESLNNLAYALRGQGDFDTAERCCRDALAIRLELLGSEDSATLRSLSNLGDILDWKGEHEEAEAVLISAAECFEATRLLVSTEGLERADYSAGWSPLPRLAALQARLGKRHEAWRRLEQNLARGLFDSAYTRETLPLTQTERDQWTNITRELERVGGQLSKSGADDASEEESHLRRRRDELRLNLARLHESIEEQYGVAAGEVYDLRRIQALMPADAAFVAWVDIKGDPHAVDSNGEHWGCVVRKSEDPIWVKLPGSGEAGAWTAEDDVLPAEVAGLLSREVAVRLPVDVPVHDLSGKLAATRAVVGQGMLVVRRHPLSDIERDALLGVSESPQWAEMVEKLHQRSLTLTGVDEVKQKCKRLADQRLEPLKQHLTDVRHLIVLPAGRLARVPVETLTEDYVVSYAPSATMYAWLKKPRNRAGQQEGARDAFLLAVADPVHDGESAGQSELVQLPGTRREVLTISRIVQEALSSEMPAAGDSPSSPTRTKLLLGAEASERNLSRLAQDGLDGVRFVHIAAHCVIDDAQPWESAFFLSPERGVPQAILQLTDELVYDGRITAGQVARTWRCLADVLVFSGCRTALGREAGGEGFLGFSQAALVSGARSVVLTLWEVEDVAASMLMIRFYENLLGRYSTTRLGIEVGAPMPKADALFEAKQWLRSLTLDQAIEWSGQFGEFTDLREQWAQRRKRQGGAFQPFEHPVYWAGFVLIGDDGPVEIQTLRHQQP